MRFVIFLVSLALLILVSADPIRILKDDLNQSAENTVLQINRIMVDSTLATAALIVEFRLADQAEIEKFQNFTHEWKSRDVVFVQDIIQLDEFRRQFFNLLPKESKEQRRSLLNQYTGGTYSQLQDKVYEYVAEQYESFKTKGTEMIRVAKEAGNTDKNIDILFDRFVQAERYHRESDFNNLLSYLKRI
ncbi:uncharacterized protein LOC117781334 [Drosophila innubila]|uniref:uncharacterized protein LOC117781334 n=1 Tax=Drosophila innubila TaxID=198719 RepID=UPI00148E6108|nr:uncharacterized protein LOC117781334 [Drosophila innubila]